MAISGNYVYVCFDDKGNTNSTYDKSGWLGSNGKLPLLVKSIENPNLLNMDMNSMDGVSVYLDGTDKQGRNQYAMGFGNHHAYSGVHVTVSLALGSHEKWTKIRAAEVSGKKKELPTSGYCAEYWKANMVAVPSSDKVTAVKQMHLLCLAALRVEAGNLFRTIKSLPGLDSYKGIADHEFAALLDLMYNMGSGYKLGSDNTVNLTKYFIDHQNEKLKFIAGDKKVSEAEVNRLRDIVVAQILEFKNAGGKPSAGIMKRRALDAKMYSDDNKANYDVRTSKVDVAGYYDANNVSTSSGGYDVTNDERASAASVTALAQSGSTTAVQAGIFSGSPENIQAAIETLRKESEKKRTEDKKKLESGNPTVTTYEASTAKLAEPHVNMVTDSRVMTGMSFPENPITKLKNDDDPADVDSISSRMAKNKISIIGQFKKYDHVNDEDLGQAKRTKFFMTRPDMCLYQNAKDSTMLSSQNFLKPSLQCHDADLLDHLTMDRDLYIYLDRRIVPDYLDTNIAFIPAYSNQFKATNLSETNFSFNKSAANIHGVAVSIPTYDTSDTVETPLSVTFNLDDQLSVMKYNDIIYKYAKGIKEKTVIAYPEIIKYNVLDFSTTAFIFILGQDGVTIESYYRAVGVVPASNPINTLPMGVVPEKMESFTINFKLNANLDTRKLQIINHFNFLNRMGCASKTFSGNLSYGYISTYDSAINWFISNYNVLEIYMLDNMRASDWYCERYQIVLDTDGIRNNYKLLAIPTVERMEQLLSFISSSSGVPNSLFNTLLNRADSKTYQVINKNTATYKRYSIDVAKGKAMGVSKDIAKLNNQYNDLQMHLDTATKYIIEEARKKQASYHTSVISGQRSFGSDSDDTGSSANIMNVFGTSTTNKRFRLPAIMNQSTYDYLNKFMNANSPLYQASMNLNNPIINHVLLNHLYSSDDKTYTMSEHTFVTAMLPNNSSTGLMLENSAPNIRVGIDGIYRIQTTSTKNTDGSVDESTRVKYGSIESFATKIKRNYKYINELGDIGIREYTATNNFEVIAKHKGPMANIALKGLFLIKDPSAETDHGNDTLITTIDSETKKFNEAAVSEKGNLRDHIDTAYYTLDYSTNTAGIMGSDPFNGMIAPMTNERGNFIERIMMYNWAATRGTYDDKTKKVTYRDGILDPSKWYLDVKHSGRLYERRLKKSPIMYDVEEAKDADGNTTLRYKAYTTMAKIINTLDPTTNTESNPESLLIDSRSAKIISDFQSTGAVSKDNIAIPQGLIFSGSLNDVPQLDQDYFAQDGRKNYLSGMSMTSQFNANNAGRWMSFYLTNTSDKTVKFYADAKIPNAFYESYKIQMYQFDLDAGSTSTINGAIQYDSNGMQVPVASGDTDTSERATFYEWLIPDGGNNISITKNYDEDHEAVSKRRLFPESLFALELEESDTKGWKAILKNKDILVDSIVNIAKSTAKTWFYQTASNLIATAVSKLLLGDRDTKNGKLAKYTFADLTLGKTYRDMRSNYPFHTDPEPIIEEATTQTHFEEIKYIAPKSSSVDIIFGYTEEEAKNNTIFEPIKVTEESIPMIDILIVNAYDTIAESLEKIQSNTPSSPSDIIMNSLKSIK